MVYREIEFPSYFAGLAKDICVARSAISKNVYRRGTERYRGKQEFEISYMGVLAELISRHYCYEYGIEAYFAPIVDKKPVVGADVIVNDVRIDVKGVPPKRSKLWVNANSHENSNKKIDVYWFIHLTGETKANNYIVSWEDVNKWHKTYSTYTMVYQRSIK